MYNPTDLSDKLFFELLEEEADINFKTESDIYVVFDGATGILYEGDMPKCYCYTKHYKKYTGFLPEIMSKERYEEMLQKFNENKITFWDYVDSLKDESDEWRIALDLGKKYHNDGKNPDIYLEEIIAKVKERMADK